MLTLFNAGPRSLSAPSAHPPQSRAGSPTRLAGRNGTTLWCMLFQSQKRHKLTTYQGGANRANARALSHLDRKQGAAFSAPLFIPSVVSLVAISAAQTVDRSSRGS